MHQSLDFLSTVGFVDHTYCNLSFIARDFIQKFPVTSDNVTTLDQFITSFLLKLTTTTRKIVLILVDYANSTLSIELENILQHLNFNKIYFNQDAVDNNLPTIIRSPFLDESTTVWHYEHIWSKYESNELSHNYPSQICSKNDVHKLPNTRVLSLHSTLGTELVKESYAWGRAHIILKKACMVTIGWITDQRHRFHNQWSYLDDRPASELIVVVDSGSKPLINLTFVAEEEDYGFLYSGMEVVDIAKESSLLSRNYFQDSLRKWP